MIETSSPLGHTGVVLSFPATVEPGDEVIFQALHNEMVLLNMKSQEYFGLDDVGSEMWNLLVQHGDVETVVAILTERYNVDQETLRQDLVALIGRLMEAGLLKAGNGSEGNADKP